MQDPLWSIYGPLLTWFPFWEYIQGGFQITNKSHKQFYKDIIEFYQNNEPNIQEVQKFHVGTDQPMLNFLLRKKLEEAMSVVDSFGKDARAINRSIDSIKNPNDDDDPDPDTPSPISSYGQVEKRKVS